MHNRLYSHIKNLLLPCVVFSMIAGFISAILVTAFKLAAEEIIHLSGNIYATARENVTLLPLIVLGTAAVGFVSSCILSKSRSCRGGGIPTSVAAVRGIINFRWIASVVLLPFSALLSFLCGLPLGTEGPCVQMGTAIGSGVVSCLGTEEQKGWRRYVMTGGAAAGFSIATASPISAIVFSMEELHKHFSPLLISVASVSVMTAEFTLQLLALVGIKSSSLFNLPNISTIAPKLLFAPLLVGLVCGACSVLFTKLYHVVDKIVHGILKKLSIKLVFPVLFAFISIIGFFLADTLGSGHSLVEILIQRKTVWYLIILVFLIRAVTMMISNTAGVTGGVFLPTLAFGAIIGSLCGEAMIALGWIGAEHYILMVILGIVAFLGATSRIPLTACVFAIEALAGISNVLAIIIAATVSFIVVELSELEDFTDTMIAAKVRSINKGKKPWVIEVPLTAGENSFAVGKEIRDILWPNSCVVVSFERAGDNHGKVGVAEGDVITVHYKTINPAATAEELKLLMGEQTEEINKIMIP